MKLTKEDQEFRNPKVFYPDAKSIDLDRVLVNLFLLLRCDGTRQATKGRLMAGVERVAYHVEQLAKMPGVKGFAEQPEVAKAWLESDIFDLVNRGKANEAVASLRPLHLDAHKIRIAKHCRDYNVADSLYAMLEYGEQEALADLKRYLDLGRDPATNRYDGRTKLDLETLTVLKLVEGIQQNYKSQEKVAASPPTCLGQSRVLCDDVQRLLAYQAVVPRPVMIDYLKTIFGLHTALYTLRLARQLSGWIYDKEAHPTCRKCPVHGYKDSPFEECPYQQSFVVDMGGNFRSRMAQLAQDDAAREYGRPIDLTKALFTMNQLLRYARENRGLGIPEDPLEVLTFLKNPDAQFDADFRARLNLLRSANESEDEGLSPDEQAILDSNLPPFERFIELITHVRQKHHLGYVTEFLDKLLQKNSEFGALIQGKSKSNPRRWHLGGRLLEVLVQLSVLKGTGTGKHDFYTEPILIEEFLKQLEVRYGFVIGTPLQFIKSAPVTLEEHKAFRDNVRALKDRLREIGFYDDLSDAYNAQTIRPRYAIRKSPKADSDG